MRRTEIVPTGVGHTSGTVWCIRSDQRADTRRTDRQGVNGQDQQQTGHGQAQSQSLQGGRYGKVIATMENVTVGEQTISASIRDATIKRGGQTIIEHMSLSIPAGTVYALVGPSGSGKTTLIRAILGLTPVAAGEIRVLGIPAGSAELRSRIGYMPQNAAIYSDLTARENLRFFASIYRTATSQVDKVLAMVELVNAADRPVSTLSGGQKQRVALAIALLPEPRLLVLDEPTVGLDPRLRARLWTQFREWAATGTTLIVSTHVMDEAGHADRIAFLSGGRLITEGSPRHLLEQTSTGDLEQAVLQLINSDHGA